MTSQPTGSDQWGRHLPAALWVPLALVSILALSLASCARNSDNTAVAEAPVFVAISPLPGSLPPVPATEPVTSPATSPPTTIAPTTIAPTTIAPTTIAPITIPPTTISPNVETVAPFDQPLQAVGGHSGQATQLIQTRLLQLGFWNTGADGTYGLTTKQAVMAFQKYIGLPATGNVDAATAAFLQNITDRPHGVADAGNLIEVDKDRQLLFIVRDGKTLWTLNTSTGSGNTYAEPDKNTPGEIQTGVAITPDGLWKVTRDRPEGWWEGDLGQIYRPKYFRGGIAVHGSNNIPNYPASHGCVRLSVAAMDFIWDQDLMPLQSPVWVHGG
jgi:peptidoglycan hydrolase-like protein with peptidoglycan-binding domain